MDQDVYYPLTPKGPHAEVMHGETVQDPYRWLEEMETKEVKNWVTAQNLVTAPYLAELPGRDRLITRLTALWDYERVGLPARRGSTIFYTHNTGLKNQAVLMVSPSLDGESRVLLDPNSWSDDATTSLAQWKPSPDGRFLAYAKSVGGSDWNTWHILDVSTGKDTPDLIEHTKFTGVSWAKDSSGFFYSRYPSAGGKGDGSKSVTVYFHRIGTQMSEDAVVFGIPNQASKNPYASVSEDGRFLIVDVREGYQANSILFADLEVEPFAFHPLFPAWDALYSFVGSHGNELYFETTKGAPNGRVIALDISDPKNPVEREIVAERQMPIQSLSMVGGKLIATWLVHAASHVELLSLNGERLRVLNLPGHGTASGFGGRKEDTETTFSFSTFTAPPTIWRLDLETGASLVWKRSKVPFDPDRFVTEQVRYPSTDGTEVTMWLVGAAKHGRIQRERPTLLYGYGGFNISLTPSYSPARIAWLEMGGLLAIPNLRGGGEYGEAWHEAGTKTKKQQVFDDFITAAEWLLREGHTAENQLAIQGGSNGGLLVGACMTQRPDLFQVCLPAVGVLDMLRYHTASANAKNWSSDYGLAENPEEFAALYAYSPVHRTVSGTSYPATLITTGDHDDRVVPWHSYKFAAALQDAHAGPAPVLLRVETRAGHGAGKPTWMVIEEVAEIWSFVAHHLRMHPLQ